MFRINDSLLFISFAIAMALMHFSDYPLTQALSTSWILFIFAIRLVQSFENSGFDAKFLRALLSVLVDISCLLYTSDAADE